jgi:hypothetical protein
MSIDWLWKHLEGCEGSGALAAMLGRHGRPIAFVVGSALSAPDPAVPDAQGVPGVAGMIERIRAVLANDADASAALETRLRARPDQDAYPIAMRFLFEWRDRDAVRAVVRDAVLEARLRPEPGREWSEQELKRIDEQSSDGWALPPGVRGLAKRLLRRADKYPGPVLTTNFDPLLSVAIQLAGGSPHRTVLADDGRLPGTEYDSRIPHHVVHLHGYWRGGATLHTEAQLTAPRPRLQASLQQLLRERTAVVVGYGGWDDAFMCALRSVLFDEDIEVVWCCYEERIDDLMKRYRGLFESVGELMRRSQFRMYVGIDCRTIFDDLLGDGPAAARVRAVPAQVGPDQQQTTARVPLMTPIVEPDPSEREADQADAAAPADLRGLLPDQVAKLRNSITRFDGFLAACAKLADRRHGSISDPGTSTPARLLLPRLQRQLDQLGAIGVHNWPDPKWATQIGPVIVQTQGALRDFRQRGEGPDELSHSIERLQELILERYPSVSGGDQGGKKKSSVPENSP